MFRRIQAQGYRCLRSISQPTRPLEILVGSNASGKSTFLDIIPFLGEVVSAGLEAAVERRTTNFHDLVWGRDGNSFGVGVEAAIPIQLQDTGPCSETHGFPEAIRYNLGVRLDTQTEKLHIESERVAFRYVDNGLPDPATEVVSRSDKLFLSTELTQRIYEREQPHRNFSALHMISDAEFPSAAWLRERLRTAIKVIDLDVDMLRKPSPPAMTDASIGKGAYLVRSVAGLKSSHPDEFGRWLRHVQSVLPDIKDVRTQLREEDRHRYLVIDYQNGVPVPSWMVSDGTLRLLALTLLAYLPDFDGLYLIEEPENGVHPTALQSIYESLSSVYSGQVFIASHSPVLLSMAKREQLLCFKKTVDGVQIVRGSEHQALRDWQGEVSLGMMAASGILG